MSKRTTKIVVVGGGTGGTLAANLLTKQLRHEIHAGEVQVQLVSGSNTHIFQPGYLHVAFKNQNPKEIIRQEDALLSSDVKRVAQDAERVDLKSKTVTLANGEKVGYDYLTVATGSVPNPSAIPGLSEAALNFHTSPEESRKIWNALEHFDSGHIVIGIAGVPHKCPPSPNEATFLLDDYLRHRGIRERVKVTFVTPYPRPYPAEPMSRVVEPRFQDRGIDVVTFFNVESVDPTKREISSLEGESLNYDLLIMIPPHRGADLVMKSGFGDSDGWIPTDKNSMRIIGYENEYAIGDSTNIPVSKIGVTAHLEAMVAVNNIVSSIRSIRELFKYTGRINCPFEMGSGKAAFVVGSYDMPVKEIHPNRVRYLMKKVFANFYWHTLSGNWDWLLSMYFGKTFEKESVPKQQSKGTLEVTETVHVARDSKCTDRHQQPLWDETCQWQ
jgi:sulfide:quinone oxidoreductase